MLRRHPCQGVSWHSDRSKPVNYGLGWLTNDDEGRPEFGIGAFRVRRIINHRQHRLLEGLGVRWFRIGSERREGVGHQRAQLETMSERAPA